ncbi:hypothetical protein CRM22_004033 [Opisthorchis felineus]|uniref:RING-type E3 ubiquitin transferase n=1 Tax=Opisthorchis felineus TaxID=147828 RepID=A0A4S2LY86_OPIFE|nr:hypothetical protein CRM22_004033 [Opisthorchis felineus]
MDSPSTSTTTHRKPTGDHQSSETSAQPDSTEGASQPSSTSGTFECHICLDSARDAVVSMCGHLFCWPCLYQWLETSKSCPVCKSAISQDRVVPLYGRGSDHTRDPRSKIPPRPAGRRAEPESNAPGFGGVFNNLFGNTDGNSASTSMVRVKYRYLVCFVSIQTSISRWPPGYPGCHPDDSCALRVNEGHLLHAIRSSVLKCHGIIGVGQCMSRLRLIHWCSASGLLVLRCLRSEATRVQAALALITRLEWGDQQRRALFDVHHSSGTVRGCQKFLVQFYSHQLFSRPYATVQTALSQLVRQKTVSQFPPKLVDEMS